MRFLCPRRENRQILRTLSDRPQHDSPPKMQQAWSRHSEPMSPMYPEDYDRERAAASPRTSFLLSPFADPSSPLPRARDG